LVLGFFLMVLASLAVIRAAAPDVYDQVNSARFLGQIACLLDHAAAVA
jgi:multisubunit Na+/H+ antiporter MnhG subunit